MSCVGHRKCRVGVAQGKKCGDLCIRKPGMQGSPVMLLPFTNLYIVQTLNKRIYLQQQNRRQMFAVYPRNNRTIALGDQPMR